MDNVAREENEALGRYSFRPMSWAFELPPATAVLTTTYVTHDRIPIFVVWRELGEDGGDLWQFHCGNGDYDPSKLQLVRLDEIVGLDPTIIELVHLAVGQSARRAGIDQPWTIVSEH